MSSLETTAKESRVRMKTVYDAPRWTDMTIMMVMLALLLVFST